MKLESKIFISDFLFVFIVDIVSQCDPPCSGVLFTIRIKGPNALENGKGAVRIRAEFSPEILYLFLTRCPSFEVKSWLE